MWYRFLSPFVLNLQNGFDQLQSLVINPTAYPSGKVSKAVILEKSRCFTMCGLFCDSETW